MWIAFVINIIIMNNVCAKNLKNERQRMLNEELTLMVGSDIVLSDSEVKANEVIMKLKNEELDKGFKKPQDFNLSKHFFQYKDVVKETDLFKILKLMPKGAALHIHDTGVLSPDYVLLLTYWENLYVCFENSDIQFQFSKTMPKSNGKKWQLMKDARYSSGNVRKFDENLRKYFTIVVGNPYEAYPDINTVWDKFQKFFIRTGNLMTYKPVWDQYFYDTLKAFKDENIMYVEIRSVLPELYDLDGRIYNTLDTARSYKETLDTFMEDNPDFLGAKLIYAPLRMVDSETVKRYIEKAIEIKEALPDFFAGFDLVGQEDNGAPLRDFYPILTEAASKLDYFFHAGETNWYGTESDENIVDAILLNTKRIGHGYALIKHPLLLEEVKKRDIALEVNVISNAVLKLVADVRNHPLASYLAMNVPVVLSSDDPGVWEADPITHDYYVTFLAVASKHADLKLLKQLAINSLTYSTYSDKNKIVNEFEVRWQKFVDKVIEGNWVNET